MSAQSPPMDPSEKPVLPKSAGPGKRILFVGLVLALVIAGIALFVQKQRIVQLRTEVASLRNDLRTALANALDNPGAPSSDAEQARREKLELIKLRNQVRELNEKFAADHAKQPGKFKELVSSLLPAPAPGPFKIRPEWTRMEDRATNLYAQSMQALRSATNELVRLLSLDMAAKMSLAVGRTEDARQFASDMLVLDQKISRGDPEKSHGQAIHDANLVLGRIAVDEGRLEDAKRYLLAAGKSTGSPTLGSFGPNMSLAKDLLEKGEQQTVLQYFELVRQFWKSGYLDTWTKDIQAGRIPDFGANLVY